MVITFKYTQFKEKIEGEMSIRTLPTNHLQIFWYFMLNPSNAEAIPSSKAQRRKDF